MYSASGANIIDRGKSDVDICYTVIARYCFTEGQDDLFLRVVQRNIACWAITAESMGDDSVFGFHKTACAKITGQFLSSGIDILFTSGYGSELGEQSKTIQQIGRDL